MPFGGLLTAGLLGAGGSLLGGILGGNSGPSKAENQLYQQEAQQMAQMFPQFMTDASQLTNFYTPYMSSGSPFLKNIQAANAGQTAQQYSNAAGTLRNQMQGQGIGFGPSGATAAVLGGLGGQAASQTASNYLQNLLNNENLKFQAAQGMSGVMGNMKPGQPATVGGQYTPSGLPGAIAGTGNFLAGLATPNPSTTQTAPYVAGTVAGY